MGTMFPFFQSPGSSPDCHDLSNSVERPDNYISQFPQDSRMHLIRSHRLMYVQVPQVVNQLLIIKAEINKHLDPVQLFLG